ncbi:hypothetical protein D5F01_LYC11695 [Larimichthys crocea]|uniref:Saposin B-type domain-containing protein n=1 Tax=Larimichthys crocea TaxID=215358 RepID=A0A6G0IF97_LARCR|nr:hypothetical protein D5F01_LYC11695 [Larimichthys crocea]
MNPAISITLLLLSATVVKSWGSLEGQTEEEEDSSSQLNHDMRERAAHHTEKDEAFPGSCTAFWTVHGRNLKVNDDDQEGAELDISVEARKLPGLCWVCKWSLNKVKKLLGRNTTAELVKEKLMRVCNEIGLLKSLCKKFVKGHLGELIEELTTSDDVRTICVNLKACKPKELSELDFESDEDAHTEMNDPLNN